MRTTKIRCLVILISLVLCWPRPWCQAQKKVTPGDYDYYALAITSISEITRDAAKLPDITQRVNVLIEAARILGPANKEEAVRQLDLILRDLKEWGSTDSASWRQRDTAATLRNEALAVYATLDSEKALVLQKETQSLEESSATNSTALSFKSGSWRAYFGDRRTAADQAAKVALSLIDSEPEKGLQLVVQSVHGGTISGVIFEIVEKLIQNRNRSLLNRLENKIGETLAANVSLDPSSLVVASTVGLVDKDMPQAAKNAFASFLMRSLQAWAMVVKEPGVDKYYVIDGYRAFSGNIRYLISQYAPDQLLEFDLLLDETTSLVPEKMRSLVQSLPAETFSEPKQRLDEILKDAIADRRDRRLIRLVSELLRNQSDDSEKTFDLAAEAISGFSDTDVKSAYTDRLTIARVDGLVRQKKIIEAQQLAGSLSSEETRAWALLAVATAANQEDKVLGFESITKALKALDAASPSPYKAELALLATSMLAKQDSRRAFETLSVAARYANLSEPKVSSKTKAPVAFGLDAKIGEAHTRLGVVPSSLSEIRIVPTLSSLAASDWFRADQIVNSVREPSLRLRLKLQFAGAVLAEELKSKKGQAVRKASANN
ncbi:MAG TPA: hypothetical protein VJ875_13235 [Pyrinomonadaceae bacterium]|nr:hypothetical protein [Pyrinomonadaceae bacterium]